MSVALDVPYRHTPSQYDHEQALETSSDPERDQEVYESELDDDEGLYALFVLDESVPHQARDSLSVCVVVL